jgi:hypothetical protein
MRRSVGVAIVVGAALVLAGCGAQTTGTSNIASDSADLHATAHCDQGQSCTWYWEYWPASGPRSSSAKTAVFGPIKGPTGNIALTQHITGLQPKTTYRWVFCGSPDGRGYGCTGPNGKFGSTTADPPPDYETFTSAAGWGIQPTPNPTGEESLLNGVSCLSTTACTAAGQSANSAGTNSTLAERWDGTAWTIQPTPNPTGASSSSLSGVSCPSATACTAVGDAAVGRGIIATVAEHWDSTTWAVQATPNATGASSSSLQGVSCTSTTACIAVGESNGTGTQSTLAERWDGTAWTIQPTPNPTGASSSSLSGLSCTSATACTAVGNYISGGVTQTLAERWDGTAWTIQPTSNPTGASSSSLSGVSCTAVTPSATDCTAVGNYTSGGVTQTLAESWDGTSWTIQATPNPTGASSSSLSGVWCITIRLKGCMAAGNYTNSAGITQTLVENFLTNSWTLQTTPNPTGASSSSLTGVSCVNAQDPCTAVGSYTNSAGTILTLAEGFSQ